MDFSAATLMPPVPGDEALVRDYLAHFFVNEDSYQPYQEYLLDTYLKEVFAETKILNGIGDMEKWYSLLNDPAKYQALKERIEIEFAPANKTFFTPDEPVALDVDVKNVKTLIVKVFEINTLNYYRDKLTPINTAIDLDGLVAGREEVKTYDDPPLRRVRRRFEFPDLKRHGVFVIEFIGNGKSSRALVQKGSFRFLDRVGRRRARVHDPRRAEPQDQQCLPLAGGARIHGGDQRRDHRALQHRAGPAAVPDQPGRPDHTGVFPASGGELRPERRHLRGPRIAAEAQEGAGHYPPGADRQRRADRAVAPGGSRADDRIHRR